jgi:hypothetical protein
MSSKNPKTLTTDEVKTLFKPFALVYDDTTVKAHIDSLTTESESLVSNWKQLYKYCLYDIGYGPTTNNREYEEIKSVREFNPYQLEVTSNEFQSKTLNKDEELDNMTKKDFVLLFAEKMDAILKLKEDAYEKQIDEKTEKANQESHKRDQQKIEQWCENHPESCVEGKPTVDILGGKSKKKSRKRNASKRRNRRTRRTHNYKKK